MLKYGYLETKITKNSKTKIVKKLNKKIDSNKTKKKIMTKLTF